MQRYYDADIGRFISPDPFGPEEDFIGHFNRYNYAMNNPVRYTDPDGTISAQLKKWNYVELGDGIIARIDKFPSGADNESRFEVHLYKDSHEFQKAALRRDKVKLDDIEINNVNDHGQWGKHGKPSVAPILKPNAQAGLNKLIQNELKLRDAIYRNKEGRLVLREHLRKKFIGYSKFLGPAGAILQYGTSNSLETLCAADSGHPAC